MKKNKANPLKCWAVKNMITNKYLEFYKSRLQAIKSLKTAGYCNGNYKAVKVTITEGWK